jgi:glycosyltransferase involved in cell wall biosynthesis
MRILHVTDSYLPTLGGIELHIRDLAARQRAAGHHVTIATRTPAAGSESADGVVRVVGSRRHWLTDAAPDVVHAHVSIVSPFALAAARRSASLGLATVVTVHSMWSHVGPLPELARVVLGMRSWDVTWSAVSEPAAQLVRELLGTRVSVVPNAVDLDEWAPRRALPPSLRVVSVMRLTSVKRAVPLVRMLRAASHDAELEATIVGDGPERAVMARYLRRHGLADRVILTGALPRHQIKLLLRGAAVFVAPAHRESFGIAALEARASGVPVVGSSRSGVRTFVTHGREGLLGDDDREMTRHLVTLLTDPVLRARMADHNRRIAPDHGWDQALRCNELVYREAIERVPTPSAWGRALPVPVS